MCDLASNTTFHIVKILNTYYCQLVSELIRLCLLSHVVCLSAPQLHSVVQSY